MTKLERTQHRFLLRENGGSEITRVGKSPPLQTFVDTEPQTRECLAKTPNSYDNQDADS